MNLESDKKYCPCCEQIKSVDEFGKAKNRKDELTYWCTKCTSEYSRQYYHSDKAKEYRAENTEKIKAQKRESGKKYRRENAEKLRLKKKEYYNNYYKEARRDRINEYAKERRKSGKICKLNKNISLAIWRSLKNGKNGSYWEGLLGYTLDDLKQHLEAQFKDGMTWENYGKNGWEIDHRIPISLFNIKSIEDKGFKKCWALENLQPLWAEENLIKYNKLLIS